MKNTKVLVNSKGFTLIELMVVVIIIGILAAIAFPQFSRQSDKAKVKAAVIDIRNIKNSLDLYYAENNSYPTTVNVDAALNDHGFPKWGESTFNDPWGNPYVYSVVDTAPTAYILYSTGKNGALDTVESAPFDDIMATESAEPVQITAADQVFAALANTSNSNGT